MPFSLSETAVSVLNLLPGRGVAEVMQNDVETEASKVFNTRREAASFVPGETEQSKDYILAADTVKTELPAACGDEKSGWQEEKDFDDPEQRQPYQWLPGLWLFGVGMCGLLLLAANLNYGRRLKRSRVRIADERIQGQSEIPVYTSPIVQTPCLYGVFHPAVYVTEEVLEEERLFEFVLCHENTHYIHKDHCWAFLRMLCFCLHWYNPLVWIAAYLSKQDGELACDEGVVKRLEGKQRIDYGSALLELSRMKSSGISGWQLSTTMRGSKLRLKERLQMIVYTPKKARGIQFVLCLLVLFLFVAAFTGKKAGDTSFAAERPEIEPLEEAFTEPLEETPAKPDRAREISPKEMAEPYQESVPVFLGDKEYQLIYEGYILGDGLYSVKSINLTDPENADTYLDTIDTAEVSGAYWQKLGTEPYPVCSQAKDGNILIADLNFDGWNDLCFQGWNTQNADIPYYCMLWNPQTQEFEYSAMLYNVETDVENQWLSCKKGEEEQYSITYYRYDTEDKLHMLRYVEKDLAKDAVFEHLDLTYVEEGSVYILPAIVEEDDLPLTMVEMAKQSLTELYQWSGDKIDTACFQVSDMGGVIFSISSEDMEHARVFFERYFGADTEYNLSGYDKSISSISVASGRSVWFSPMLFRVQPANIDTMTDEEVVIWYFERVPLAGNSKVKTIEQHYEDMWTIQTENGSWFEVVYNAKLREVGNVTGPYPDYPIH